MPVCPMFNQYVENLKQAAAEAEKSKAAGTSAVVPYTGTKKYSEGIGVQGRGSNNIRMALIIFLFISL